MLKFQCNRKGGAVSDFRFHVEITIGMDSYLNHRLFLDTDLHRFKELIKKEWILILISGNIKSPSAK